MKQFFLVLISLFLIVPPLTQAGRLSDFEESATSNKEDNGAAESHDNDNDNDDDDDDDQYYYEDDYEDGLHSSSRKGSFAGARTSTRRSLNLARSSDRTAGEHSLPTLRADVAYQNVDSDVEAVDLRLDIGIDFGAFHYSEVNYKEEDTGDKLQLSYYHVVYRHQFSPELEWHVGGGVVGLGGEDVNTGGSLTSQLTYRPLDWLAVEFRPTWSSINDNSIRDYDLGVHFGRKFAFMKAGYRWVQSGDTNLDAVYIGASFRY